MIDPQVILAMVPVVTLARSRDRMHE